MKLLKVFLFIFTGIWVSNSMAINSGAVPVQNDTVQVKFKVYGTVLCQSTIEGIFAGRGEVVQVSWSHITNEIHIIFLSAKTDIDKIAYEIALAGFDNEFYLANDEAYDQLSKECRYPRPGEHIEGSFSLEGRSKSDLNIDIKEAGKARKAKKAKKVRKAKREVEDGA